MNGEERRNKIINILKSSQEPISGNAISSLLQVSRQIVVQDIAILRANRYDIVAMNRGYVLQENKELQRVFKVNHADDEIEQELQDIVDFGGQIKDVFVYHKVYGVVKAQLNIKSRRDINHYMENIRNGNSTPLKNVTSGFHYHTIIADCEDTLDEIQKKLEEDGFLAKLQDYEPVNFWK